jgi:hypothetical protein
MKKNTFLKIILSLLLVLLAGQHLYAFQFFRVGSTQVEINKFNTCKRVTASNGLEYFVPTNTESEWSIFRQNKPAPVNLSDCMNPNEIVVCPCATSASSVCMSIQNAIGFSAMTSCSEANSSTYMTSFVPATGSVVVSGTAEFAQGMGQNIGAIVPIFVSPTNLLIASYMYGFPTFNPPTPPENTLGTALSAYLATNNNLRGTDGYYTTTGGECTTSGMGSPCTLFGFWVATPTNQLGFNTQVACQRSGGVNGTLHLIARSAFYFSPGDIGMGGGGGMPASWMSGPTSYACY